MRIISFKSGKVNDLLLESAMQILPVLRVANTGFTCATNDETEQLDRHFHRKQRIMETAKYSAAVTHIFSQIFSIVFQEFC